MLIRSSLILVGTAKKSQFILLRERKFLYVCNHRFRMNGSNTECQFCGVCWIVWTMNNNLHTLSPSTFMLCDSCVDYDGSLKRHFGGSLEVLTR